MFRIFCFFLWYDLFINVHLIFIWLITVTWTYITYSTIIFFNFFILDFYIIVIFLILCDILHKYTVLTVYYVNTALIVADISTSMLFVKFKDSNITRSIRFFENIIINWYKDSSLYVIHLYLLFHYYKHLRHKFI